MGKAVGGFFRFVFAVIILLLVGYNTFETWRLRQELNALKDARRSPTTKAAGAAIPGGSKGGGALNQMEKARAHTERARELLREKQYVEAQREIALAAKAAGQAGSDAREQSADAVASLRRTVETLSAQADSLMREQDGTGAAPPPEPRPGKESEKVKR